MSHLSNVTVLDGSDNSTQTVTVGQNPYALAVNPVTNRIYVANNGSSSTVTVIDGADNSTQSVFVGSNPFFVAANPITNKIYADGSGNTVVVIDEQNEQDIPLDVTITPLPNDVSVNRRCEFSVEASSTYAPNTPAITQIYFQIDTNMGEWIKATPAGSMATIQTDLLTEGEHVLYSFATDTQIISGSSSYSAMIGEIAAYPFSVVDAVGGNVNLGGAGSAEDVLLINGSHGGDDRSVDVLRGERITISMDASSAGPLMDARYVFWVWVGGFGSANPSPLGFGSQHIGVFAKPIPLQPGQNPQPRFCIRSDVEPNVDCRGTVEKPGPNRAPFSITKATGLNGAFELLLQGLLQDQGSLSSTNFSVTNAVVLHVE